MQFLSTPSARRATRQRGPCRHHRSISIHALREEGDIDQQAEIDSYLEISIHALREEGDSSLNAGVGGAGNFYPRPPRGGRHGIDRLDDVHLPFLSTPSARRATGDDHGRPLEAIISIHALREEGDWQTSVSKLFSTKFLSTPSARRATPCIETLLCVASISIHALREEGDGFVFHGADVV